MTSPQTVGTASRSFVFVTGNANKLREVSAILDSSGSSGISVTSQSVDVPEVQGSTQEVAIAKCKAAARVLQSACVTEDTALCFESLHDLPGPYIKDFLTKLGHEGLNKLLDGFDSRRAYALCTFAYSPKPSESDPEPEVILFEGRTYGQIVRPRGPTHFGWDAVFEPEEGEGGKTFAEMDGVEKNKISHRYRALEKLREWLLTQPAT